MIGGTFPFGKEKCTGGVFGGQYCGGCASQEGPRHQTSMVFNCSVVTLLEAGQRDCLSLESVPIVRVSYRIVFRSHDWTQTSSIGSGLDVSNPRLQLVRSIR
jgi:hypothetical protein